MIPTPDGSRDLTQAVLRPVRGYHAFEACVEQLATTIRLGVYPRGSMLPARARAGPAAARLAVHVARGDGGAARRPDWSRPPAAAAAAPSSPSSRVRRPAEPLPGSRRPRARTGWTPSTSGGSWSPAPPHGRAPPTSRTAPRAQLEQAHADVVAARKPAAAPAGRLPLPPHRGHPHRVAARGRGGDLGPGRPCTRCCWRSPCSRPTSPTPTGSTPRWCGRSSPGEPDRARRVMEEHCDDTAALLRGLVG